GMNRGGRALKRKRKRSQRDGTSQRPTPSRSLTRRLRFSARPTPIAPPPTTLYSSLDPFSPASRIDASNGPTSASSSPSPAPAPQPDQPPRHVHRRLRREPRQRPLERVRRAVAPVAVPRRHRLAQRLHPARHRVQESPRQPRDAGLVEAHLAQRPQPPRRP